MNQKEWFDHCVKNGTSGDQIFDILEDWEVERLTLMNLLREANEEIDSLRDEIIFNRKGRDRWE